MAKYIDAEKLNTEIERLYNGEAPKHDQQCDFDDGYFTGIGAISQFIDSLQQEQPEVDLEKELDEWMKYGPHTNYPWCTIPDAIKITAEYFFDLGLNARNE